MALRFVNDRPSDAVAVSGEIDMAVEEDFRALLAEAGAREPAAIDLSDVSFIDSCGLRQILQAAAQAAGLGKVLEIRNPSPPVRHLFELTLPEEVPGLRIYHDENGQGHG